MQAGTRPLPYTRGRATRLMRIRSCRCGAGGSALNSPTWTSFWAAEVRRNSDTFPSAGQARPSVTKITPPVGFCGPSEVRGFACSRSVRLISVSEGCQRSLWVTGGVAACGGSAVVAVLAETLIATVYGVSRTGQVFAPSRGPKGLTGSWVVEVPKRGGSEPADADAVTAPGSLAVVGADVRPGQLLRPAAARAAQVHSWPAEMRRSRRRRRHRRDGRAAASPWWDAAPHMVTETVPAPASGPAPSGHDGPSPSDPTQPAIRQSPWQSRSTSYLRSRCRIWLSSSL